MPIKPTIRGVSDIRRWPRLGKIRLGYRMVKRYPDGREVEYPKEAPYFICPPEVQAKYGKEPTVLPVRFPVEDETKFFPQNYKAYVLQGLRCRGDGERALRRADDLVWKDKGGKVLDDATKRVVGNGKPEAPDPNDLVEIGCPCRLADLGVCGYKANLMVLLPEVSMGGVYQIDTGSFYNITRINSAIDYVRSLVGRIAMVPLKLCRQEEVIQYEDKKAKHYLLQLVADFTLEEVVRLRADNQLILTEVRRIALPAPVDDGPDPAPPLVEIVEEGAEGLAQVGPPKPEMPGIPGPGQEQPTQAAPAPVKPATEETPVQYWKRQILTSKSLADLSALWGSFAKKAGRYHDFTEQEQKELREAKDQRKAELSKPAEQMDLGNRA